MIMTTQKAKDLGWKFTGKGNDLTIEKGRIIMMCPSRALALKMIVNIELDNSSDKG